MEIEKVSKIYLSTTLEFLTYTIDKGYVEEQEERYQDNLRKQRRH